MTGFGRSSFEVGGAGFDVEVKSVNHRYLDVRVRVPRVLFAHEAAARAMVQARVARGKVDLSVALPAGRAPSPRLEVDVEAAEQYHDAAERLRQGRLVAGALDVGTLLGLPGVSRLVEPELPPEALERAFLEAAEAALAAADDMRAAEGATIERELRSRLDSIIGLVDDVEGRADRVQAAARERLRKRTEQLRQETGLLDEARLHQEIVIAVDRLDITEELLRLRSHVDQFRGILGAAEMGQPAGRRLNFLLQEMARECNTVGSKAGDAPVAHLVIELKTDVERLREQVQNVE